ncbi:MAG: hypothetical protein ACOCWN_01710, partial [Halanaerobium sp.]
ETQKIDLEVLIGEDWEYSVEVGDLEYQKEEEVQNFRTELKNLSSVHIIPRVALNLIDEEGVTVETLNLRLEEDKSQLFPEESAVMSLRTTEIEAGNYTAEIIVSSQNQEIETIDQTVIIE